MPRMTLSFFFLMSAALVAWLATDIDAKQAGNAKVDIRGAITKMSAAADKAKQGGLLAVLMIEGKKTSDTNYDKASVKVTDKTVIKIRAGKDLKNAKLEDLKQGRNVEANFTGPVLESYPVQATAKEIVILEEVK